MKRKVWMLKEVKISTVGTITSVSEYSYVYNTFERAQKNMQLNARIFEEIYENDDSVSVRIIDDDRECVVMARIIDDFDGFDSLFEQRYFIQEREL